MISKEEQRKKRAAERDAMWSEFLAGLDRSCRRWEEFLQSGELERHIKAGQELEKTRSPFADAW